jgi:enoyl-CoA hydratase/carnithine racemase
MSTGLITYDVEGKVALIGLNRADKRNAISEAVITELRDAVLRAGDEADAGVLFGHGQNFSAGLDLAELAARIAPEAQRPRKPRPHSWHTTFDLITLSRAARFPSSRLFKVP